MATDNIRSPFELLSKAIFEYRKSHKGDAPNEVFINPYFRSDLIKCIEKLTILHPYDGDGKERFEGVILTQRAQVEPISFDK